MKALKNGLMLLLKAVLPIVSAVIFIYTIKTYYGSYTGFFNKGYILFGLVYAFFYCVFMHMYGGFNLRTEKPRNLLLSGIISHIISNLLIYTTLSLLALKFVSPPALLVSMAAQIFTCGILDYALVLLTRLIFPTRSTIAIISDSENDIITVRRVTASDNLHKVTKTVSFNELTEDFSELEGYSAVLLGDIPQKMRADILTYCYNNEKEILIIPSMQDILLNNSAQYIVSDKLLYSDRYTGFSPEAAFFKRLFDIVFSVLAIIITSPVMAIVAILVHSYDKGPALFRQERLTRGGKQFTIVKFRSMVENAEKDGGTYLVLDSDDRITPIGKFIRAARIDELPQLFNILKGDMSFVGPRPERPELYAIYSKDCPEFNYRLKVKAGLTGYAQVYGRYNTTAEDKVKLDLLYIEKASLLQDLQIMLYTLKVVFMKESSEGLTDTEKAAKK